MRSIKGVTGPGDRCPWCGAPATTTVEVEPIRAEKTGGRTEILDLPIRTVVCDSHAGIAAGGGPDPAATMRKHARGVERTSLFDPDGGPADAIRGLDG